MPEDADRFIGNSFLRGKENRTEGNEGNDQYDPWSRWHGGIAIGDIGPDNSGNGIEYDCQEQEPFQVIRPVAGRYGRGDQHGRHQHHTHGLYTRNDGNNGKGC